MVVTKEGLQDVRSVKRLPEEKIWGEDNLNWVKWAPWRRYKNAVDADGDLPEGVPVEEQKGSGEGRGGVMNSA